MIDGINNRSGGWISSGVSIGDSIVAVNQMNLQTDGQPRQTYLDVGIEWMDFGYGAKEGVHQMR